MTDPWCCYIWCAMDPIKINPLYVSIFIPAPAGSVMGYGKSPILRSESSGSEPRCLELNGAAAAALFFWGSCWRGISNHKDPVSSSHISNMLGICSMFPCGGLMLYIALCFSLPWTPIVFRSTKLPPIRTLKRSPLTKWSDRWIISNIW